MLLAPAIFVSFLVLSVGLVGFACVTAWRFTPELERPQGVRWLIPWAGKGLLIPVAIWVALNTGLSESLQPFMPQVQAAQNKGAAWFPAFFRVTIAGWFAISSSWCGVTLGWIVSRAGARLNDTARSDFRSLCVASLAGMLAPAILIFSLGGWITLGIAIVVLLAPIAGYAPALLQRRKLPPMYARAVARMKFGKYSEAEWAILQELEKCEDDFDGWLMLAGLYANQFNGLAEAEQTVLEICDQPRTTSSQLSVALHKLADWHLNLAGDPDAARRALHVICQRLPGTHLARMAELRLNQLPRTAEELHAQRQGHTIALPVSMDPLDEPDAVPAAAPEPALAAARTGKLLERLARDPADLPAREELARVLASQPGQVDSAIEQLEALLGLSGQPNQKYAEWLSLIAAWQLRRKQDTRAARQTLQRLIREFPETPQAFNARRHLTQLELGQKMPPDPTSRPPSIRIRITPDADASLPE